MPFLADYHVHLEKGPYTAAWLSRFVTVARRRGLCELGLTEHLCDFYEGQEASGTWWAGAPAGEDRDYSRRWWQGRPRRSLEEYFALIKASCPAGITLRLGVEVDYFPASEASLRRLLAAYPFDLVLGSVHWLDGWGFDHLDRLERWQDRDVDAVYRRYFAELGRAARSGLFDVLAHVDLIKIAGYRPAFDLTPLYAEAARTIAAAGVAVEVSTAGLRKPVQEIYPAEPFLRLLHEHGVPITLASDAHTPEDVGRDFDAAVALARRCGYEHVCRFVQRRREQRWLTVNGRRGTEN
jgi:histidinol-phosphatase (PHP family)